MGTYAKTIVATIGAGITTALTIPDLPPKLRLTLMVVSAMVTAVGVYWVPNTPEPPRA